MSTSAETTHILQQEIYLLKNENRVIKTKLASLHQAVQALRDFQECISTITPLVNLNAILYRILTSALEAVNSENASLLLLDESTNELVFVESNSPFREQLIGYRFPADEGVAGWVSSNRIPRLVPDTRHDPEFSPIVDRAIGYESQSIICVPLLGNERVLGVLEVVNSKEGEPFNSEDLDIMILIGWLASIALVRAEGYP
jgi:GAF domain-containing protein